MKVHFIGDRGVSMKRLKALTASMGHSVSGSDEMTTGHDARFLSCAELVVYSGAIKDDNPELKVARERGLATVERSEYLGALAEGYDVTVAIAGSHGKTTVTAMTATVLTRYKPTVHIGANYPYRADEENRVFITEACEYRKSLLALSPTLAVILNAELDHTDCYDSVQAVAEVFSQFAFKSKSVLFNGDDTLLRGGMPVGALSFGLSEGNDFRALNIQKRTDEKYSFDFVFKDKKVGELTTGVIGFHNIYNSLASASVALMLGVPFSEIEKSLSRFSGVSRRMERVGEVNGATVISDYAHHPTEIKATLQALKSSRRLIAVFEPHTYSRTRDLFDEFTTAFALADEVIFLPVYASREKEGKVDSSMLFLAVKDRQSAKYFSDYSTLSAYLKRTLKKGETVVFLGAGTIDDACREFVKKSI